MITENEFNRIKNLADSYKHTSMTYTQYESISSFELVCETPEIVALFGKSEEGMAELLYAVNTMDALVNEARKHAAPFLVCFVPPEWHAPLLNMGFTEYGVLRDYWIKDLTGLIGLTNTCEIARPDEAEQISAVTVSCAGESREFRGESTEWVLSWLSNQDPNAKDCESDCTILCVHEGSVVVGVACIAIYLKSDGKPVLWLRELAVMRDYQHRGYGRRLLRSALSYGIEHGCYYSFLSADELNKNALALYKSEGYVADDDVQIDLLRI